MIIEQTRKAISYYKLAIENAENMLEFQVKRDEEYIAFQEKYTKLSISTIFYSHTQDFSFYDFSKKENRQYFRISNGVFYIENEHEKIEDMKEVAQELLDIVKKFY